MYIAKDIELAFRLIPRHRPRWAVALTAIVGLLLFLTIGGCSSVMNVKDNAPLHAGASWALLPFSDFGETPQAGARAEEIANSLLRVRWNIDMERYPVSKEAAGLVDLDERQRYEKALQWARDQGFMYGLSGSVQEWRYRNGSEGEAAVGVSLRVVNIKTGRPEWIATGSSSGFGSQTVSGVAERLLNKMIAQMKMK